MKKIIITGITSLVFLFLGLFLFGLLRKPGLGLGALLYVPISIFFIMISVTGFTVIVASVFKKNIGFVKTFGIIFLLSILLYIATAAFRLFLLKA